MKTKSIALLLIMMFALCCVATAQVSNGAAKAPAFRDKSDPLKIGETAPDFTLTDTAGKQITLSKAGRPVVLVFHRGYW